MRLGVGPAMELVQREGPPHMKEAGPQAEHAIRTEAAVEALVAVVDGDAAAPTPSFFEVHGGPGGMP